jgi:hypothetical protein
MKKTWIIIATAYAPLLMALPVHAQISSTITLQKHIFSVLIGNPITPSDTSYGDTTIMIGCAQPHDTVTAFFTIISISTFGTVITRVIQTDTTDFFDLFGTLDNQYTWDPTKTPQAMQMGDTAIISIKYVVPVGRNDTIVDSLIAFNEEDDTIGGEALTLTVISMNCAEVRNDDVSDLSLDATIIPINDARSLEIILPTSMAVPVSFQLFNVLGESVLHETFSAGTQMVDASFLPRGVYFYRVVSGQSSQSGKVILGE